MTDPKSQNEQNETPEDVATLYSWANLHGAKYRDFSVTRAQAREEARRRVEAALAAEERRRQEEAERQAEEERQIAARQAAEAAEAARRAEAERLAEIARQAEAERQAVLAAQQAQRQAAMQRNWQPQGGEKLPDGSATASQPAAGRPGPATPAASGSVTGASSGLGSGLGSGPAGRMGAGFGSGPDLRSGPSAGSLEGTSVKSQGPQQPAAATSGPGFPQNPGQAGIPTPAAGNAGAAMLKSDPASEPPGSDSYSQSYLPEYGGYPATGSQYPGSQFPGKPVGFEPLEPDTFAASDWPSAEAPESQSRPAWLAALPEQQPMPAPAPYAQQPFPPAASPIAQQPGAPRQAGQFPASYGQAGEFGLHLGSTAPPEEYSGSYPARHNAGAETVPTMYGGGYQAASPAAKFGPNPGQGGAAAAGSSPGTASNLQSGTTPVDNTLVGHRDRMASRWFALKSVFDPGPPLPQEQQPQQPAVRPPVLAVFSLAGGVGKTSLVASLGRALSSRGEKILLVDTASFGLLPFFFGARDQRPGMLRTFNPPGVSTDAPVQLVTLDPDGQAAEAAGPEWLMQEVSRYGRGASRIILDLPTASGSITRRALKLAPAVLVPVVPDMNSVVSVGAIEAFFRHSNANSGGKNLPYYVLNQFDYSLPLHLDVREILREQIGDRLLPFALRRSPQVSEALAEGMTVMDYAPTAVVAEDYASLAGWVRSLSAPATVGHRGVRWSER
jgi:cellulose synthase operon protein YhjQ